MEKIKKGYYISTICLSAMMCMSAGMYFFKHADIAKVFTALGYPTYIIYPLGIAKILGLIAIWSRKSITLVNLAYAGFLYNFILAFFAHIMVGDGEFWGALIALIFLLNSYITQKRVFSS